MDNETITAEGQTTDPGSFKFDTNIFPIISLTLLNLQLSSSLIGFHSGLSEL